MGDMPCPNSDLCSALAESQAELARTQAALQKAESELAALRLSNKRLCRHTGCTERGTLTCTGCGSVQYCSQGHRDADWPEHRRECKAIGLRVLRRWRQILALGQCVRPLAVASAAKAASSPSAGLGVAVAVGWQLHRRVSSSSEPPRGLGGGSRQRHPLSPAGRTPLRYLAQPFVPPGSSVSGNASSSFSRVQAELATLGLDGRAQLGPHLFMQQIGPAGLVDILQQACSGLPADAWYSKGMRGRLQAEQVVDGLCRPGKLHEYG